MASREDRGMFWRRPRPVLTEHDVTTMFRARWDIRRNTFLILAILLTEEDNDEL
jgi:hypothetical protein